MAVFQSIEIILILIYGTFINVKLPTLLCPSQTSLVLFHNVQNSLGKFLSIFFSQAYLH